MNAELFEPDGFQLTPPHAGQSRTAPQAGKARRGRAKAVPAQQSADEWLRDYDAGAFTSEKQYELAQRFEAAPLAQAPMKRQGCPWLWHTAQATWRKLPRQSVVHTLPCPSSCLR